MPAERAASPPQSVSSRFLTAAVVGFWFGLIAGLVEVLWTGGRRLGLGRLVFVPEYWWWTAPLASAVFGAIVVGLLATPFSRRPDRHRAVGFAAGASLVAIGGLVLIGGLHRGAAVLLGIGIGIRAGTWLAERRGVDRFLRRSVAPLAIIGPIVAVLAFRLPARGGTPGLAPSRAMPNVLLIVLDTVRAIELSLYGAPWRTTPAIDRFARGGVVFDRASSTAPWTAPSHASLFTGVLPEASAIDWFHPLERSQPTLAETLAALGYETAGFVANTEYASQETGLARGFATYEDHELNAAHLIRATRLMRTIVGVADRLAGPHDLPGRIEAATINERFLRWLDDRRERPFFAFLNYYDAHAPYYAPEPFWSRFVPDAPRRPLDNSPRDHWDPDEVRLQRQAYAAGLGYLDFRLGELLDTLRARGILDNTIVIVTSDHGEEFHEHQAMGHGHTLHRPSVHVPLIIVGPGGVPAECRLDAPVSGRDIPATVMDLLAQPSRFPGSSLVPLWTDRGDPARAVVRTQVDRSINLPARYPVSGGPIVGVERGRFRMIQEPQRTMLFDLVADPLERRDLSADSGTRSTYRHLERLLESPTDSAAVSAPDSLFGAGLVAGCRSSANVQR